MTLISTNRARRKAALSLVALIAMLAPTLGLFVDHDLSAWMPAHGHIGDPAAIPAHTHPYEATQHGSDAEREGSDVTFTPARNGALGSAALSVGAAQLPAPGDVYALARAVAIGLHTSHTALVPTPPPRA